MNDRSTLLLEHHLKELKLPTFLREYGKMAAQCAAEGVDHSQCLLRLAELELIDRHQRMVERRVRAARFPAVKSLDTFDFPAIPSVNKSLLMELARCEYIQRRENVIAVGNSGTGKTHIALGLGPGRVPAGAWPRASAGCARSVCAVCGLHHRSSAGARVDGGPGREKAAEPAEADVPPRPADHRRIGLCTVVPNRRGATLRRFQPAACGSRCGAR